MTTATNEACIESSHEHCYLVRGIFLVLEMNIFFIAGKESPHLHGFPKTVDFGEEIEQSIHGGGNKQNQRRWNIVW